MNDIDKNFLDLFIKSFMSLIENPLFKDSIGLRWEYFLNWLDGRYPTLSLFKKFSSKFFSSMYIAIKNRSFF